MRAATRSLSGGRKSTKFWPHCSSCHPKVCSQGAAGTQLVTGPILWSDLPSLGPGLSVRAASAAAVQHHLQPSMPTTFASASMLPVRSSQTSQVLPELSVLAPGAAAVQQHRQQEMSAASIQQHVQPVMPAAIARAMEPPGRFFQPSQYEPNLPAPPPLMTHPSAQVQQDCEAVVEESLGRQNGIKAGRGSCC